jgi:transposase-like protein
MTMQHHTDITDAQRDEAARRYADGEPIDQLTATYGVAASTLSGWAHARDLRRRQPNQHPDQVRHAAVTAYLSGSTLTDVAAHHGTSTTSVSRWVRNAGHRVRSHGHSHVPACLRNAAARLVTDGRATAAQLAEILCVDPATIHGWARRHRR